MATTIAPVASEATGDRAPADSFERARREAGRDRHAPEQAGPDVGHPLGHRLLVQVDPIAMPRGECLGVARRLGEPDQQEREGRDDDGREVLRHELERWDLRDGQAAWHGADERHAARAEVEDDGADEAADDEHEGAGDLRKPEPEPEDHGEGDEPDQQRRRAETAQAADPRCELLPGVHAVGGGPRELGQLPDDDVDGGAGEEAGHDRPGQEAGEPAELEDGDQQEQRAGDDRDRGHQLRGLVARQAGHQDRAAGDRRE